MAVLNSSCDGGFVCGICYSCFSFRFGASGMLCFVSVAFLSTFIYSVFVGL